MKHIFLKCFECKTNNNFLIGEDDFEGNYDCKKCSMNLFGINNISGFVYILSHPHLEYLKIGFTKRELKERIKELNSSTSIPGKFKLEAAYTSKAPEDDEKKVHTHFSNERVDKEFFKIEIKLAIDSATELLSEPFYINPDLTNEWERIKRDKQKQKESGKAKKYNTYVNSKHNGSNKEQNQSNHHERKSSSKKSNKCAYSSCTDAVFSLYEGKSYCRKHYQKVTKSSRALAIQLLRSENNRK